jgi:hypothetical protein
MFGCRHGEIPPNGEAKRGIYLDTTMSQHAIVNVGVSGWYAKGSERLGRSLNYHGYEGEFYAWRNAYPEGSPTHKENPYAFKLHAIKHALEQRHTRIFWVDCSGWLIRHPDKHLAALEVDGYYLFHSGFTVADWTNDACLEYFGVTREEAKEMPMLASGVLGLNFDTEVAREFFAQWWNAMEAGTFRGSWSDHRHDQSAASIIAHRLGMRQHAHQYLDYYYQPEMPEHVEIVLRGM